MTWIRAKELITMRLRTAGRRPRTSRAVPSRPSPRGALRVTAVAAVLVAAGMTAGSAPTASQASEQPVTLRLSYSCAFHFGTTPVSAQVTATYPTAAMVGQPIQPTGTRIAVTLPHAAVANLRQLHAARVTLAAGLGTVVSEGTKSATAPWQDFSSPAKTIPPSGPLTFTALGAAPQVREATPGQMTVTATGLELLFTPSAAHGTAASPSALPVVCVPVPNQDRALASIAITSTASSPAQSGRRSTPAISSPYCPDFPKHLKPNPRFHLPPPPPGSNVINNPQPACSYAGGFTDAQKLHEAALVGPGLTDLEIGDPTYTKFPPAAPYTYIQIRAAGQLNYHGLPELPPARATFLAFGFMPVSATLQVSETGSLDAALISCVPAKPSAKCPNNPANEALFFGRVMLRIYDVDINGVPLNVGSHCQTATPFNLELIGVPPSYSISGVYGVLTGFVTVPSFSGCANHTDNLDPVFDATVSGPDNFVKITQAPPCYILTKQGCPPVKPHLKH